jgi:hypothetical protein
MVCSTLEGEWCVPKKGTREHKEVLSIMQGATLYTNTRSEKARRGKRAETDFKQTQHRLDRDVSNLAIFIFEAKFLRDNFGCDSCDSLA